MSAQSPPYWRAIPKGLVTVRPESSHLHFRPKQSGLLLVVRRIGGRNSHPGFHRVLSNRSMLAQHIRPASAKYLPFRKGDPHWCRGVLALIVFPIPLPWEPRGYSSSARAFVAWQEAATALRRRLATPPSASRSILLSSTSSFRETLLNRPAWQPP